MNKIDINKPVQLEDGTVATFEVNVTDPYGNRPCGRFKIEGSCWKDGSLTGGSWNYYLDTGEWVGGRGPEKLLQNVPEVAPKVDFSKPLETFDGQRVELLPEKSDDGEYWRVRIDGSWGVRHYSEDGKHRFGDQPDIRNVAEVEAPKIDWTKPIEDSEGRRCYVNAGSRYHCPPSTYVVDFDPHSDSGNFFDASGYREGEGSGHSPSGQLRNVAEVPAPAAPALDLTKPLQTRDGRPVALITSEGRGKYPVLGYVGDDTGPTSWTSEGNYQAHTAPRDEDLVNVEDKPDVFFGSIYRCGSVNTWNDESVAYFPSEEGRVTVKVTFPKDGKPTVELL